MCVRSCVFAWCLCLQSNLVLMIVGYCPACNSDRQECVWTVLSVCVCMCQCVCVCALMNVCVCRCHPLVSLKSVVVQWGLLWLWRALWWFANQSQVLKLRPKLWQWLPVSWNNLLPLNNLTWFQWLLLCHQGNCCVMLLGESVLPRLPGQHKMGHSVFVLFFFFWLYVVVVFGICWWFGRLISGWCIHCRWRFCSNPA